MKKALALCSLCALCLLAGYLVRAGNTVLVGALATVNNTTLNSGGALVSSNVFPLGKVLIQNAGLTATNALTVNFQASIDSNNWLTVATYYPSVTNATTDTFAPAYPSLPFYLRAQVITTNSVQVGITYFQ